MLSGRKKCKNTRQMTCTSLAVYYIKKTPDCCSALACWLAVMQPSLSAVWLGFLSVRPTSTVCVSAMASLDCFVVVKAGKILFGESSY